MRILIVHFFFFIFLFAFSNNSIKAQGATMLRSVFSMGGSSPPLAPENNQYYLKQSIGQPGVTGTFSYNNKILIQGFILPNISRAKVEPEIEPKIDIKTIPFSGSYRIVLNERDICDVKVSVFNMTGQNILTRMIYQSNEFEINLHSNPVGCYILFVETDRKQYKSKIIKTN